MNLISELSIEFGLGQGDLESLAASAPARYKSYEIPKRNGGNRIISQPSRDLKLIQRYILRTKLEALPVHHAATAYTKGRNIRENAEAHLGARCILKLDFHQFFPSLRPRDFSSYIRRNRPDNIEIDDIRLYEKFLFWGNGSRTPACLSIGAPTSPIISNILLFDLDVSAQSYADKNGLNYTRYADDITVSSRDTDSLLAFESWYRKLIFNSKSPKLTFNQEKRGIYLPGGRRMVTGLVITPNSMISIGRERKRTISSLIHRAKLGELDADRMSHLKGLIGFCIANEPDFVGRMRSKYGDRILDFILEYKIPPRSDR